MGKNVQTLRANIYLKTDLKYYIFETMQAGCYWNSMPFVLAFYLGFLFESVD
jgi:hypothetical protein